MSCGVEAYTQADRPKVDANTTDAIKEHNHGP